MPFGKYKGRPLYELPDDYLEWLSTRELRGTLKSAVIRELRKRTGIETAHPGPSGALLDVRGIAAAWYRRLAVEFHPDKGGSHEAMKAINRGRDLLLELVGIES